MLSVRSYHAGATASAIDSGMEELLSAEQQGPSAIGQQNRSAEEELRSVEQQKAPPAKGEPKQKFMKNPTPMQHDQMLLKAVSEHGLTSSILPKSYEHIRQKYNMTGHIYDYYWRLAAGSQLTSRKNLPRSDSKARHELGRLKGEILGKREDNTLIGKDTIPNHKGLMAEAKELAKNMRAAENRKVRREVEDLVGDFEEQMNLEIEPQGLQVLQALEQASEPRARLTKRQKWRENKRIAAEEAERNMTLEQIAQRRQEKKRAELATKQIQRFTRLNKLERRSFELQEEAENLRKMEAEEKAHRLAILRRGEEFARRQKERSTNLADVLDVATEKVTTEWGPFPATERRPRPLPFRRYLPDLERTPSNDLYLTIPPSGEIYIDPDLTMNFYADTATLKQQIVQMQDRLKVSYPRIDTLPYDVSKSDNRNSLQTWLKILAGRWQKRYEKATDLAGDDAEVKAILDQMVRDHDLSNHSADRMAKKWKNIMRKREAGGVEAKEQKPVDIKMDEELDWDEFNAGGMGFLKADDADGVRVGKVVENAEEELMAEEERDAAVEEPRIQREANEQGLEALLASLQPRKRIPSRSAAREPLTTSTRSNVDASEHVTQSANTKRVMWTPGSRQFSTISGRCSYSTSSRPSLDPALAPKPSQSSTSIAPSSTVPPPSPPSYQSPPPSLPHLTSTGTAHMVPISSKPATTRTAIAVGTVYFSNPTPLSLIKSNALKKGDVLAVSRIAGIMAAKKCPDLVPLCHPIAITAVGVEVEVVDPPSPPQDQPNGESVDRKVNTETGDEDDMSHGHISIQASVSCTGPTGVEMEALTAVMGAALSVVDMCKAVDKGQRIGGVRVVVKEGGRSGNWRENGWGEG